MSRFPQFATCHSHPQSLDSASTPEAFAKREVELGGVALTATDHGSLAAIYQIYDLAKKHKLIACPGLEAYFRDDNCPILGQLGIEKTDTIPKGMDRDKWMAQHPDGKSYFDYLKYMHLTLGFRDYNAYLCAVRLLSKADDRAERHGSERKPLFTWDDIEELASHNITAGSGCLVGMTQRHLINDGISGNIKVDAAKKYFDRLKHLFGDRFYVEVFPHCCTHNWVKAVFVSIQHPDGSIEKKRYYFGKKFRTNHSEISAEHLADRWNDAGHGGHTRFEAVKNYRQWEDVGALGTAIIKVEKVEGFIQNECSPAAPNGDVQWGANRFVMSMAKQYGVPIQPADDSHFATSANKIVQDVRLCQHGDWRFHNSYHRFSSEEAYAYFETHHNTPESEFRQWVDNSLAWADGFRGFEFKTEPSLPTKFFPADTLAHTKKLIEKHGRLVKDKRYIDRLKAEIDVLHRNGKIDLLPYFFIDEDVCRLYSNQGELTAPGRGSAAGMLLTYLLGITHVDPLKYDLSLERFITLDRIQSGKLPDIDQDLPSRDLLVGMETDVVEFVAEDGTRHILPETMKIETSQGLMTAAEAAEAGVDIEPWWLSENSSNP